MEKIINGVVYYPNANNKTQITLDDALPLITQFEEASNEEKVAEARKDEAITST